jgi:hypothetical protein
MAVWLIAAFTYAERGVSPYGVDDGAGQDLFQRQGRCDYWRAKSY